MITTRRTIAFTLVELLVVIMILGILAAIALPRILPASEDAKLATLEQDEAVLNKAIELYKLQHDGVYPGVSAEEKSWDIFVKQMISRTDKRGEPGTKYGPYLRTGIPVNPLTGTRSGKLGQIILDDKATGWFYDLTKGIIRGNRLGASGAEARTEPGLLET